MDSTQTKLAVHHSVQVVYRCNLCLNWWFHPVCIVFTWFVCGYRRAVSTSVWFVPRRGEDCKIAPAEQETEDKVIFNTLKKQEERPCVGVWEIVWPSHISESRKHSRMTFHFLGLLESLKFYPTVQPFTYSKRKVCCTDKSINHTNIFQYMLHSAPVSANCMWRSCPCLQLCILWLYLFRLFVSFRSCVSLWSQSTVCYYVHCRAIISTWWMLASLG